MDLKTKYTVKGLGTEKVIESLIKIHTDEKGEKILKVEDRWNGDIPEGPIAKVSDVLSLRGLVGVGWKLVNPWWWARYWRDWGFWVLCWGWETRVWEVGGWKVSSIITTTHSCLSHPRAVVKFCIILLPLLTLCA